MCAVLRVGCKYLWPDYEMSRFSANGRWYSAQALWVRPFNPIFASEVIQKRPPPSRGVCMLQLLLHWRTVEWILFTSSTLNTYFIFTRAARIIFFSIKLSEGFWPSFNDTIVILIHYPIKPTISCTMILPALFSVFLSGNSQFSFLHCQSSRSFLVSTLFRRTQEDNPT